MPSRRSIANEEDWGDQPALFDTSVEIFRYLVVISPSPEMIGDVSQLKRKVAAAIGSFRSEHSIAHMTLLYAYLPKVYERELAEAISRATRVQSAFSVHFSGIHLLPDHSTIYIDPLEKEPIVALRKSIRRNLQSNKSLKRLGIHATTQPMITIARKLDPERSAKAWASLHPHEFHREERIEAVLLLRGSLKEGERYTISGRFPLVS